MLNRRDFSMMLGASFAVESKGFDKLTEAIRSGAYPNTHAVIAEHHGRIIYEQYFSGNDERWGEKLGKRVFDARSMHDLRSVSKSVTSAVLGIALGSGAEKALKQPIGSFFPKLKLKPELEAVTLHHVLTMTAGLDWNEMTEPYTNGKNDELQMSTVKDPVAMVLSRSLRDKPGTVWYYNGGLTQVLCGVVRQVAGVPFAEFAKQRLFAPLGITNYEWIGDTNWNPPVPAAASGLRLTAPDLTKFGSLYLNGGRWKKRQIVPAAWVDRSLAKQVEKIGTWYGKPKWGYGYQWWVGSPAGYEVAAGVGNGNQRVYVSKKERMVVTVFAGEYNSFEGHSERLLGALMAARG